MNRTTVAAGTLFAAVVLATALGCLGHRPALPPSPEGPAGPVVGIYVYTMPKVCRSRMECSGSDDCVKPEGSVERRGVCGVPIDAEGRLAGLDVRRVPQCGVPSDCPGNFTCMKMSMQDGLCVR
ncbi:MAG TPA: hypothetical protein VIG99_13580 [Myxococcaceae bacterium]|jgi:hypothetical protein